MDTSPKFWAYFADYDWVVFCQLFGSMIKLPEWFPHYCRDIKQEMARMGISKPVLKNVPNHNALVDAKAAKEMFEHLVKKGLKPF
jgi:DNA polymerase III epsilon subunit-like protein